MKTHYQVLIIGGGTGGIMVSARLKRKKPDVSIGIIEPSDTHSYQPAYSLVGAGTYNIQKTKRPESSVIPSGTDWIRDRATEIDPKQQTVSTEKNGDIRYDYLVVAPGLVYDLSLIEGLEDAIRSGAVCSNYIDPEYTWKCVQEFKGGNAVFTQPPTPIKCGGAPQKAMYLSADYFRKKGLSEKTNILFATPGTVIFGVKPTADTLMKVIDRYNINLKLHHTPVKIDGDKKIVYFRNDMPGDKVSQLKDYPGTKINAEGILEIPFDLLHLAPPQVAPEFIRNSDLSNSAGWLEVNHHSLQHKRYKNIFGVGDVADLPTAKTGAAIRKQAPVVVDNLIKLMNRQPASNHDYQGYSSCPLVTGYGKMVLAEFNYNNEFIPDPMLRFMLITDSDKEHWRLWLLKKYGLPFLYWNRMMKGKM